jgi:hypothetical protein
MYKPNDGFNHGRLACGGTFTHKQNHIAYRRWHRVGCGTKVVVCSVDTSRCSVSYVRDAGPYGIYKPPLKHAVREGRWRVWTRSEPPKGWRWRTVVDLSYGLWRLLGEPAALSKVHLFFGHKSKRDLRVDREVASRMMRQWSVYWPVFVYNVYGASFQDPHLIQQVPSHRLFGVWPWPLLLFLF